MRPRVAILEASHWHVPLYLEALKEQTDVIAVSDRDPEVAGRIAAVFAARPFDDWGAALDAPGVDLVFAFGRHREMPDIARSIIERGIPFSIEKPGGLSSAQIREIADLADTRSAVATVPFVQRFGPLAELLRSIGRPDHVAFRFIAGPPSRYPKAGCAWMLDPAEAGGGCFVNLGSHFVDLFSLVIEEPITTVVGRVHRRAHGTPIDDHAAVLLESASGRSALIETGYLFPDSPRKREISYYASSPEGYLSVGDDGTAVLTTASGASHVERVNVDSDPLYGLFVRRVVSALGENFAGLPTLRDLEYVMRVVDKVYGRSGS